MKTSLTLILPPMISRLALISLGWCGLAAASQPTSLADLPDANPDAELKAFVVPEGFEVNLFASEPMIQKPVQMNWDAQGRLWVVSSTTYPHIKPGEAAKDQVVVLEDTVTTGGSSLKAIEAMRGAGYHVRGVLAVVDRNEGGAEALAAIGVPLVSLFDLKDLAQ